MYQHYFKIALRHLQKQRFFAFINISGLAVGLACCLLILLFVRHEMNYDKHLKNSENIYRVIVDGLRNGSVIKGSVTSTPLAEAIMDKSPDVVNATRLAPNMFDSGTNLIKRREGEENRYEEGFVYADPSFLAMFPFEILEGDAKNPLGKPNTMVITESKAKALFGNSSPIGQTVILNNSAESTYQITAVIPDLPSNTHLEFSYLIAMEGLAQSKIPNWGFNNYLTYLELTPNADLKLVEDKLLKMVQENRPDLVTLLANPENKFAFKLQPVADVHLHSAGVQGYWSHGDIQYVRIFAAIAFFILLIAVINFMNLSTAKSANRAKEVGLRKVLGSMKYQLKGQFLAESTVISLLALVLALPVVQMLLPAFNELTETEVSIPWSAWWLIPSVIGMVVLIGILAGIYPAFFLSSFQPIKVLKGKFSNGSGSGKFRSSLVIFQFTISIALIIGSLVVQRQIEFMQNKKLGFDKEQILIIEDTYTLDDQIGTFKSQLQQLATVEEVSVTGFVPVDGYNVNYSGGWADGRQEEEAGINIAKWYVDYDYVKTLGMNILEGRDFSEEMSMDSAAVILNERAVRELELEDPIGKKVNSYTGLDPETGELYWESYTVIGVMEDFHFKTMKQEIGALSLVIGNSRAATMVKTSGENIPRLISDIEGVWGGLVADQPFRYSFLDAQFEQMYQSERRSGQLFMVFTGLAIFVACLGLFALATFMAEQRSKEISVRKVLGATVFEIVFMLSKNFALLVFIALLIAIPTAWYFMNNWLADFAYRVNIGWDIFALSGVLAMILAVLTIGYQADRAARANPAERLRDE